MTATAIALVGNPNVGKPVPFHRLTGAYVDVDNHPGTTVGVAREVIPPFLPGTLIMVTLDRVGVLPAVIRAVEPLVSGRQGLPKEASAAFVMGFLRRDFGAAGLLALSRTPNPIQAVVGLVALTLFVPRLASAMMIVKEQGPGIAAAMPALIVPFAFEDSMARHVWVIRR